MPTESQSDWDQPEQQPLPPYRGHWNEPPTVPEAVGSEVVGQVNLGVWARELEAAAAAGALISGWHAADLCGVEPGTIRVWANRGRISSVTYQWNLGTGHQRDAMYRLADVLPLARSKGGPFMPDGYEPRETSDQRPLAERVSERAELVSRRHEQAEASLARGRGLPSRLTSVR